MVLVCGPPILRMDLRVLWLILVVEALILLVMCWPERDLDLLMWVQHDAWIDWTQEDRLFVY